MDHPTDLVTHIEGLDPAQRQGVEAGGGLLVVLAGAGTGKTRVLTTRAVRLVRDGLDPRRLVAATLTRKAAAEMRERSEALGGPSMAGARFGTLHSLAVRVLREHPEAAGLASADFLIADDDEVAEVVGEALDATGALGAAVEGEEKEWAAERRKLVRSAGRRISRWKENGLTPEAVADPDRERRGEEDEAYAAVYLRYAERMAERGLLDFGDLTMLAVRALETSPAALEAVAGRIGHLMVDEFQDTNAVQLRMIRLLSSRGADVTVVGDDDQSLYSFRGAIPRLMEQVAEFLPEVAARGLATVRLETNYRCTDDVLGPANLLVDHNPRAEPKVLASGRNGTPVTVSAHPSDVAEAEEVARRVQALVSAGADPGEIAVLVRSRAAASEIGTALVKHRVPHVMQAGTGFMDRAEVKDLLAYLKLALDPAHDLAFQRIAARPTRGLGPAAVDAVVERARGGGLALHEALSAMSASGQLKGAAKAGGAQLGRHLAALREAAGTGEAVEDLLRFVADTVGYLDWARAQKEPPATLASSLDVLLEISRTKATLAEFMDDLAASDSSEERARGAVHVGTLHGSKGLEWDHVLMPAFEEKVLPSERALEDGNQRHDPEDPWCTTSAGGLAEERRLAHVGLTRARLSAHVSFATMRKQFGRPQPAKPSRFLREAELEVPRTVSKGPDAAARRAARGQAKRRAPDWF